MVEHIHVVNSVLIWVLVIITLGVHAHEGYGSQFVCLSVCTTLLPA